jgi:hypothetical protein
MSFFFLKNYAMYIVGTSYVAYYSIDQHAEKRLTAAALMRKLVKPKIQQRE